MRTYLYRCLIAVVLLAQFNGAVAAEKAELFPERIRTAAKNEPTILLFPEDGQLHGWVNHRLDGEKVVIFYAKTSEKVDLDKQGRFLWKHSDESVARTLRIKYGKLEKVVSLPARVASEPVAFFVIDRSVCRVGSAFHFTAFLRQENKKGKFEPYQAKPVEVEIRSKSKGIVVANLKLTPDANGKIVGKYTFTAADPLDDYTVACKDGIHGKAVVKLAEFRKAKVRLAISGERERESFTLQFKTLDFLGKKVPSSQLKFTAVVQRKRAPKLSLWGLNPAMFYGYKKGESSWYVMDLEQRALLEAGNPNVQSLAENAVLHQFSEVLEMGKDGELSYKMLIDPLWKKDCEIKIIASVVDANNREQHASRIISLNPEANTNDSLIDFQLTETVAAGKPIDLIAKNKNGEIQSLSFVIFELQTTSQPLFPQLNQLNVFQQQNHLHVIPNHRINGFRPSSLHYNYQSGVQLKYAVQRKFITINIAQKAADQWISKLRLTRPGAYVVKALAMDEKGNQTEIERTLVVKSADVANALHLALDQTQLEQGAELTGELQSRFTNATVLLIVRDAQGIAAIEPVSLAGNKSRFSITFPRPLSLACSITAMYTDDGNVLHQQRQRFQQRPAYRPIKITSKLPDNVPPGETVELDFQIDRKEEVDLVVSVYDKSLLGVAPHKPVDGPSLFFADTRVEQDRAERMVQQYLRGCSKNSILKSLNLVLKDEKFTQTVHGKLLLELKNNLMSDYLHGRTLRVLLAWKGAPISLVEGQNLYHYWHVRFKEGDGDRPLNEMIQTTTRGVNLSFVLRGNQLGMVVKQESRGGRPERVLFNEFAPKVYQRNYYGRNSGWGNGAGGGGFGIPANRMNSLRGDGSFSATANASFSNLSGQAMISHLPAQAQTVGNGADAGMSVRVNFSDSAFFSGKIRTDANGKAKVKFKLPDSLTHWHVVVTAVSKDLSIGQHSASFKTYKPVMVWPMLPQSFTSGDRVKIFAKVHNLTDKKQEFKVAAQARNGVIHGEKSRTVIIPAQSNKSVYFDYEAGKSGFTEILMSVTSAAGEDASLKRLPVYNCTAEQVLTRSGFVKGMVDMTLPKEIDLEQSQLEITIAPSIAGDMLDSLEYLIDYPHGCVEQTMSRFLPVIKVAQILKENKINDPALTKKVPLYAEAGIKRLLELQQKDGGWGWQGTGRTHEMMTPYALYGLIEAKKAGFKIPNETAIERGLTRLESFINYMGTGQSADRIYCMWVYSQEKPLKKEWWTWLETISNKTLTSKRVRNDLLSDYATALALEIATKSKVNKKPLADKLLRLLSYRAKYNENKTQAHWTTSGFSRWGNDHFEITAAVLKAVVAHNADHQLVEQTLHFFAATKRGNKWNSTKDTAMILYAMCDYLAKQNVGLNSAQSVTELTINGKPYSITNPSWKPKKMIIPGKDIQGGRLQIDYTKGNKAHLYRIVYRYWKQGKDVAAVNTGMSVKRRFELVDQTGKSLRLLKSGDTIPRGSYIRSTVYATCSKNRVEFTLLANPKISAAEYTKSTQLQPQYKAYVLEEKKSSGVYWHYENASRSFNNISTYRVEMEGTFLVAPAYAELMYDTAVRGNSDSFYLNVKDAAEE